MGEVDILNISSLPPRLFWFLIVIKSVVGRWLIRDWNNIVQFSHSLHYIQSTCQLLSHLCARMVNNHKPPKWYTSAHYDPASICHVDDRRHRYSLQAQSRCAAAKYIGSGSGLVWETSSGQTKTAQRSVKFSASIMFHLSQRGFIGDMPQRISWFQVFRFNKRIHARKQVGIYCDIGTVGI